MVEKASQFSGQKVKKNTPVEHEVGLGNGHF